MTRPDRLPLTSLSPNQDRTDILKSLFPEAFTEDKIDFERLKQALGAAIQTDRERYGLNWAGKSDAIHTLQSLSVGTLEPQREQSVNFDTTENIIIEGDNLEVLKLLQKSYFGKVKMIYIDPPYNTGGEFIYPDNFREGLEEYLRYSGQVSEGGTATTSNKETDGRYHSNWLSMMYPRLFLARNLLRDDGVIFVSIDDHEVHDLRLLMNEIFGEENFVICLIWHRRQMADSRNEDRASSDHEYVLVYQKSHATLRGVDIDLEKYKNPDNDPRGPWFSADLTGLATKEQRPNLHYDVTDPNTGVTYPPSKTRGWSCSKANFQRYISEGKILWPAKADGRPRIKKFLNEVTNFQTGFSSMLKIGFTTEGTREIQVLFGEKIFPFPKPVALIRSLAHQITQDGDIVLDFFAGSGTTAQAVMELNAEDEGNRKFILVQLPEQTKNKEFPTIADITRERVQRVIAKMNEADGGKLDLTSGTAPDRGFKALRLTRSNFKIWEGADTGATDADALAAQLELFADNLQPDATPENILFEVLLKAGYDLNVSRSEIAVADQKAYAIGSGSLIICLERRIDRAALDAIIARDPKPETVICLNEAFHGDDALLTNALLQMQDTGINFQTI